MVNKKLTTSCTRGIISSNKGRKKEFLMNYQEFKDKYNIKLNKQQEAAVQTIDGPCLLLAVPGSGKTTVLVTRLGYMIFSKNINPSNILTLTYTVAATHDMKDRFVQKFGDSVPVEFRTINGISAKIIDYYSKVAGREPFDLITDEKERLRLITRLYQDTTGRYPAESDTKDVSTKITYIKNMLLTEEEIREMEKEIDYPLFEIYSGYNRRMREEKKMDYDDQMLYAYNILKSSPDALSFFQNRYKYICVDEAQDTSKIQHILIKLLAGKRDNLFMVGDEDQSIYGFRAAYPAALLNFGKEHPGAKILLMEENFRSNKNIVDAADCFIQKNRLRYKKTLKATRESASPVSKLQVKGRRGQYEHLLKMVQESSEETAILYRDNESIIPVIDLFERNNIPFRIKNAELSFFTHRVVVDIVNILKFALDPTDTDLFMNIYYKLSLYIPKREAEALCMLCKRNNVSIFKAVSDVKFSNPGMKMNLIKLREDCRVISKLKPDEAVGYIKNIMGYGNYLSRSHISDSKIFTIKEVFRRCSDIPSAINRLGEISRIIMENDSESNLILSTIHSSKGLEYKNVYIIDVIDGVFPDAKDSMTEEYEEQRRIFYVGITRAKDNLYLFRTGEPSRFIDEMKLPSNNKKNSSLLPSYEDYLSNLTPGTKVMHQKLKEGTIVSVKIPFVSIDFGDKERTFGIKQLYDKNLLEFC